MPRMIDGDTLYHTLADWVNPDPDRLTEGDQAIIECINAILTAPTIDQERHGYWIQHRGGDGEYDECSRCGYEAGLGFAYSLDYKYCPACGARMDLEAPHEQ